MLKCTQLQETYSALSVTDSLSYASVKAAVLKVYEMVPEAYRQRFGNDRTEDKQSYREFSRDLLSTFNRWCPAFEVETFDDLCNNKLQFPAVLPHT